MLRFSMIMIVGRW